MALAGLSWRMQIGAERQLLLSALRSTVQLFLIGLVLKVLFDNGHPLWVALLATGCCWSPGAR
jgi:putative ABC transport system permease protein